MCQGKRKYKKNKVLHYFKKGRTYTSAIRIKIKVKKNYKVFYQTSGTFKKSKVINGGKSKVIKIKKTTVLSLCAVKKSVKVTSKKLNKILKQNKKHIMQNINIQLREAAQSIQQLLENQPLYRCKRHRQTVNLTIRECRKGKVWHRRN